MLTQRVLETGVPYLIWRHMYWSTPMTFPSINNMSGKYSTDIALMDSLPVQFHITSCKYLGYMLSPDGLTMALNKVQIIQDWLEPHTVKDIQSFLGFTNFYCHFIYGYSRITILLMHFTCKGIPWHFTNECHSAFNALKKAFLPLQS